MTSFTCKICFKIYSSKQSLCNHTRIKHNVYNVVENKDSDINSVPSVVCTDHSIHNEQDKYNCVCRNNKHGLLFRQP